jgi:uncharacterized membrane protein (UPF0127 family)
MSRFCSLLLALAFLVVAMPTAWGQGTETFEKSPLAIETAGGRVDFTVELAVTTAQRAQGLMYRRKLARDAGMLFDYGQTQRAAMWMKNTYIPLDMLFIAEDGRVVRIAERTIPHSLAVIGSGEPVRAVLELKGGSAAHLGIKPGDRVRHELFGTSLR